MSPSRRTALSSDLPTTTIKLMSRPGWNISQSGRNMSRWVDLACPLGHIKTALRFGVSRTVLAASLWNGALCIVLTTSPVVLSLSWR